MHCNNNEQYVLCFVIHILLTLHMLFLLNQIHLVLFQGHFAFDMTQNYFIIFFAKQICIFAFVDVQNDEYIEFGYIYIDAIATVSTICIQAN